MVIMAETSHIPKNLEKLIKKSDLEFVGEINQYDLEKGKLNNKIIRDFMTSEYALLIRYPYSGPDSDIYYNVYIKK